MTEREYQHVDDAVPEDEGVGEIPAEEPEYPEEED
jgi:hypothetical protein